MWVPPPVCQTPNPGDPEPVRSVLALLAACVVGLLLLFALAGCGRMATPRTPGIHDPGLTTPNGHRILLVGSTWVVDPPRVVFDK